jgi:putative nucleotidyltransferase with HDIG domain
MRIQLHPSTSAGTSLLTSPPCSTRNSAVEQQPRFPQVFSALIQTLQIKDVGLYQHSSRTKYCSQRFSLALGFTSSEIRIIAMGALLHDIGKVGIHEKILYKTAKLSQHEYTIVKEHPVWGAKFLSSLAGFEQVMPIVRHHHERWDGRGYPDGLSGMDIPIGARIVAIVDAFDAMLSNRPYQVARTPLYAMQELYRCAGTQFDPTLVHYFCAALDRELHIHAN